jgi:hypothetical protein
VCGSLITVEACRKQNTVARFKQGDRVLIQENAGPLFAGMIGIIEEVKPNPRNVEKLDSYTVVFPWGEKRPFWDAQLELAP